MKTTTFFFCGCAAVAGLAILPAAAQSDNVTRGIDVKGADVKGSDVSGGSVTGGSVTGGSVTGGSVTGGNVTGGSVSGGSVTPGSVTPGTVTSHVNGREIQVRAAGSVAVNSNGGNAEVKIGSQMLVIQKSKLLLDGKPLADLPGESKKVEVEVQDQLLTVKADGKEVSKTKLK